MTGCIPIPLTLCIFESSFFCFLGLEASSFPPPAFGGLELPSFPPPAFGGLELPLPPPPWCPIPPTIAPTAEAPATPPIIGPTGTFPPILPPKDPIFPFGCPIFPIILPAFSAVSEQFNITASLFSGLSGNTLFPSTTLTIFEHFKVISFELAVTPLFIAVSFFGRFSDTLEHFNIISFEPPPSDNGISALFTFFTVFEHFSCIPLMLPVLSV